MITTAVMFCLMTAVIGFIVFGLTFQLEEIPWAQAFIFLYSFIALGIGIGLLVFHV